MANLDFC